MDELNRRSGASCMLNTSQSFLFGSHNSINIVYSIRRRSCQVRSGATSMPKVCTVVLAHVLFEVAAVLSFANLLTAFCVRERPGV